MDLWTEKKKRGDRLFTEASNIINGERQDQYGNTEESFVLISDLWTHYIHSISKAGHKFFGEMPCLENRDVAFMLVLLKIAREMHQHKRDNLIDIAGYLGILDDMETDGNE